MAGGFFALLDDVASILDDVAAMTKVATKKTAGVLGDDLALNANQLTGIRASRELPIIWAVSKGSLLNKAIIVPIAFLLSAFLPAVVPLILMIGGAYLCYEGVEKILHRLLHHHEEATPTQADDAQTPEQQEQDKIRSAIRTDFILSIEIIVIALASFVGKPLVTQILGLSIVALVLTAAVYGVVAIIVKIDDLGLYWSKTANRILQTAGQTRPDCSKPCLWLGRRPCLSSAATSGSKTSRHCTTSPNAGRITWAALLPGARTPHYPSPSAAWSALLRILSLQASPNCAIAEKSYPYNALVASLQKACNQLSIMYYCPP